jgi:uncharacterized membrane protein
MDPAAGAALNNRSDLISVRDDTCVVSAGGAELPASLRTVSAPNAEIEKLLRGRRPADRSEVTVSQFIATSLDVDTGSEVVALSGDVAAPAIIVGITTTPADRRASVVIAFDPELDPSEATTLLTDTDIAADPKVVSLFANRSLTLSRVASLANEEASAGGDDLLSVLDLPLPGSVVTIVAVVGLVLLLVSQRTRSERAALEAAGMGPTRVARLFAHAAMLLSTTGVLLALIVGWVLARLGRSQISKRLGQDWSDVTAPWDHLFPFAVAILSALAAGLYLGPSVHRSGLRFPRIALARRTAVVLIVVWAPLIGLWLVGLLPVGVAGVWGAVAAIAAPFALGVPRLLEPTPGRRRFTSVMVVSLMPIMVIGVATTWLATKYAADFAHESKSAIADSALPQPPGSLLVYEAPSASADVLSGAYQRFGGRDVEVFAMPVETERQFRASSRLLTGCMADGGLTDWSLVGPSCVPSDSSSPINVFLLSLNDPTAGVTADPALIEAGEIGVLMFTPTSGGNAVENVSVSAVPDPRLGGNMPGGVVGVDSPIASRLGMTPGSGRLVAFLDFASLDDRDQASFRSLIRKVAGAAQVVDDSGYYLGAGQSLAISRVIAIAGAALAALLVGFGGGAVVEAQRSSRRALIDIGSNSQQRRRIARRVTVVPIIATTSASAFGLFSAWITGVHTGAGFGYTWLLPGSAAVLAWISVGRAFAATPPA